MDKEKEKKTITLGDMDGIKKIFDLNYQAYNTFSGSLGEIFDKGLKIYKKNMLMIIGILELRLWLLIDWLNWENF